MKSLFESNFKNYFLALIIFLSTLNSVAQDSQLFENTWYLHNVIINGENNIPPSNGEVPSIPLYFFDEDNFETDICNYLAGSITFGDITTSFSFIELVQSLIVCDIQENSEYENLYFQNFYFANHEFPFSYSIVQNTDTSKTLTITNINGDQAIYGSALLSVTQKYFKEIKLYPNPVANIVNIDVMASDDNLKLNIFNVQGQLKLTKNINTKTINVSNLESGIYFFVFETQDGKTETKRIIKH